MLRAGPRPKPQWGLYPAKDCYLVDNANLHRLLQVPAVPNDPQVQSQAPVCSPHMHNRHKINR